MREAVLWTHCDRFILAHMYMSARQVGSAFLVASSIVSHGPLAIEKIRKVARLRGREQWLPEWLEEKLFIRKDGFLYLRDDVFSVKYRGTDRVRATLPASLRARIHERDNYQCQYCGDENGPFEIDHIHPVSRGGTDEEDNLCLACKPCNISKSNKLLTEWVR